jgi:hypothetical protein
MALQHDEDQQRRDHRDRNCDVRRAPQTGPAEPRPDRQRPGGPGEERQVFQRVAGHGTGRPGKGIETGVHPLIEIPDGVVGVGGEGRHRPRQRQHEGDRQARKQQPARAGLGHDDCHRERADQQRGYQHGVACQCDEAECEAPYQRALDRLVDHPHQAVDEHRDADELCKLRRGFVAAFGKAEAGEQDQQRAVGQRTAVVARFRLAAERVFERLNLGAAAKQIGRVPDERAGDTKQQRR